MKGTVFFTPVVCVALLALGCGEDKTPTSDTDLIAAEIQEATRQLEEVERRLEEARKKLAEQAAPVADLQEVAEADPALFPSVAQPDGQASTHKLSDQPALAAGEAEPEPELFPFVAPPDHLAPFEVASGFGHPEEVAHFWSWAQHWEFTQAHAKNTQRPGGAVLASTYKLSGDFQITIKGSMTKSWTNSKRTQFEVCGQAIGLANWRPTGIDLVVSRRGSQLTYAMHGNEPVVIELNEEQAGPTEARLVVYGRHASIKQFEIKADAADRMVPGG